jgi:methylmalonyl-CoA/ethylmalonyl-CoA epimerase
MLTDLDHIGIAVDSLESVCKTLRDGLGLSPQFEEEIADQNVRVAGFKIGQSVIEYIEPLSSDSPISRFLEKRGNGLHHLAFRVVNLDKSLISLKEKGYRLIDEEPREGADGKKIAFLHPTSFNGILIELCEY